MATRMQQSSSACTLPTVTLAGSGCTAGTAIRLGHSRARGPCACLAVRAEHVDADQRLVERGVGGLHQVVVGVLRIVQGFQALPRTLATLFSSPARLRPAAQASHPSCPDAACMPPVAVAQGAQPSAPWPDRASPAARWAAGARLGDELEERAQVLGRGRGHEDVAVPQRQRARDGQAERLPGEARAGTAARAAAHQCSRQVELVLSGRDGTSSLVY